MSNGTRRIFLLLTAELLAAAGAAWSNPTVTNVRFVEQKRIDRFIIEATYRADVTSSSSAFRSVTATVTSGNAATTIIDSSLSFPDVASGGTVTSTDTFTIRHDLHTPFQNNFIQFQVSATPDVPNRAPTADAGPSQTVTLDLPVTLNGSRSNDPDGNSITFSWTLTSRPAGSAAALSNPTSVNPTFVPDKHGTYIITLVVSDGTLTSTPHSVEISTLNSRPLAKAGPDRTGTTGATVTLDGSASSDPDGNPLTFSWTIVTRPSGSIAALSNPAAVMPTLAIDVFGTYVVRLVVSDGQLNSLPDDVTVNTQNSAPVANAGPNQTTPLAQTIQLNGSGSTDIDGQPLTFSWSITSKPLGSAAVLSNATAVTPSILVDKPGTYTVQLIVNDGLVNSSPDTMMITTTNTAPVANAGPDQTGKVGVQVTLSGSASSDVDGDPLTFAWSLTTRPPGSSATLSSPTAVMPTFVPDEVGQYIAQLIVKDGKVSSPADTVSINVGNTSPIANAGPDQTVPIKSAVTLTGSGSTDVDGNPLTYTWSFVSRPAGSSATLSNPTAVMPTFTADVPGNFVVQLIVNDGTLNSTPDTVKITTTNTAPTANAGPDQVAIIGAVVQLNGALSSDPEGASLTYSWSLVIRPAGSTATLTNPTSVATSFTIDMAGTYVAQLIVNDGFLNSAPDQVTIAIDVPPVANAGPDQPVPVGSTVLLDGSGSSDAGGQALTYSWSLITRPTSSTATLTNPTSVAPTFVADRPGTYVAQLIANDGAINSAPDTVTITTANRPPTANAGADANAVVGQTVQLIGTGSSDPDGDPITYFWSITSKPLTSTATLTNPTVAAPSLTLDVPGPYTIQLIVNDGKVNSAPESVTVTATGPITGGVLINGSLHTGSIDAAGEVDTWTFTATAGDRIAVHIGEITDNNDFRPWLRLQGPGGSNLGGAFGLGAAELGDIIAPTTGTYTVLVASADPGLDGTGTYRLTMTHSPGPITFAAGDEGGPLTNGGIHTGAILRGDADVWTFTVAAGERIAVHIGEISETDDFRPWIRIWAPNGASLGAAFGVDAAQIGDVIAPVAGTYLVVVASADPGVDGAGTYRLTLAKTLGPITVSAGDEGGALTNGGVHTGEILQGDVDVWTFTANVGERIALHIGEMTETDDFRPWIRIWAPNGASLGAAFGVDAAEIGDVIAPIAGTYLVIVASADPGVDGIGTYRLNMTKTAGSIVTSPGDQGGSLTNGGIHTGEIVQGDLDVWTFTAAAGDRIAVHIGEMTETDDFRPWIRIWAPNGASLGASFGVDAAQIGDVIAPVAGTYVVIVGSADPGVDGTGTYRINMAKTSGSVTVSPGDQGGSLSNGGVHTGEIVQGDIDVWTFTAVAGERIGVHIGEISETDDFRPWIRIWAPNGASLGASFGVDAAEVGDLIASVTGTYVVIVGSADPGVDGTGTYRINMAKTPGPVTVSSGDEGGGLTNGAIHTGAILQGDIDVWTFSALPGERIGVHIGEISETDDFRPWIRIWAPNGASLGASFGVDAAQIGDVIAPVAGTYLVIVGSADPGVNGTGTYRLSLAKTPGPITVSSGDQGGPLASAGVHNGEVVQGDLDVWTITAVAGQQISVQITKTAETDDFRPWIRVWAPTGASLGASFGLNSATVGGIFAPVTGTYLVIVGSADPGVNGAGTYQLTATVN